MKIENNTIIVEDDDLPINEKMTKFDCYGKGMIDLAEKVKFIVDTAKTSKEQHSYMYWGNILDSLINDLECLTSDILSHKNKK